MRHVTYNDSRRVVVIDLCPPNELYRFGYFRLPRVGNTSMSWARVVPGQLGPRTEQTVYMTANGIETTTVTVVQAYPAVENMLRRMSGKDEARERDDQPSSCLNAHTIMEADGVIIAVTRNAPSEVHQFDALLPGLLATLNRCRWILFVSRERNLNAPDDMVNRLHAAIEATLGRTVYVGQTTESQSVVITALINDRSFIPSASLPERPVEDVNAVPVLQAQHIPALWTRADTAAQASAYDVACSIATSTPRQPALVRIDRMFLDNGHTAFGIVTVLRGRLQGNTMFRCQAFPDSDVLMVETLTSLHGDVKIGTATAGAVVRVTARFCLCEPHGEAVRIMNSLSPDRCASPGRASYNRQMSEGTTWFEAPNPLDAAELPLPTVSAILKLRNPTHEFLTELRRDPNKPFEAAIALTGSAAATLQIRLLEGSEDEVWVVDLGNCTKPRHWGASLNIYPGGRQGGIGSSVVLLLTDERRDRVMSCAAEVVERWDFVASAIARVPTSHRLRHSAAPVPPPLPVGLVTSEQILFALSGNGGHSKASSRLVRLLCDFTFPAVGTAKERSAGGTAKKDSADVPFRPLLAALLSKDLLLEVDRLVLNFGHTLHARVEPLNTPLIRGVDRNRAGDGITDERPSTAEARLQQRLHTKIRQPPARFTELWMNLDTVGWRLRPTLLEELLMAPCDGDSALKAAACAPAVLAVLVVGHIWNPVSNGAESSCHHPIWNRCFKRYLRGDQCEDYADLLPAFRLVSLQQRFLPPRPRSRPFQPMAAHHPSALRRLYPHIELAARMMSPEYAAHVATALNGIPRSDWCRPHRQGDQDTTAAGCQAAQLTDPRSSGTKPRCRVMATDADLKRRLYGAAASPRDAPPGVCAELLYRFWHLYEHHLHLHASGEATAGSLPPVRCIAETLGHSVAALQLRLLAVPLYRIVFGSKHDGSGAATSSPPFPQVRGRDGEMPATTYVRGGGALVDHGGSKTAVIARMLPRPLVRERKAAGLPRWLVLYASCVGDPRPEVAYGTVHDPTNVTLPTTQLAPKPVVHRIWSREFSRLQRVLVPEASCYHGYGHTVLAKAVFSLRCIAFQQVLGGIGRRDAQRGSLGLPEGVVKLIFLFWHGDWRAYL
jgi:hypothetical protein